MAEYILQILRSQLMVVFSWGFHKPQRLPKDSGLKFQVEGLKYKGTVEVIYNEHSAAPRYIAPMAMVASSGGMEPTRRIRRSR